MTNCEHVWVYVGNERQKVWRCSLCDRYKIEDVAKTHRWSRLTESDCDEILVQVVVDSKGMSYLPVFEFVRAVESAIRKKNT